MRQQTNSRYRTNGGGGDANNDTESMVGWAGLPGSAIHRIACFVGGISALNFCNSCRTFQQHQVRGEMNFVVSFQMNCKMKLIV